MKGPGRVFLRGRRWWIGFYVDGEEHRESLGPTVASEREARRRLALRIAEVGRGEWSAPGAGPTVAEVLDQWLADIELRGKKSVPRIRRVCAQIKGWLGQQTVEGLASAQIKPWLRDRLADGLKPGTVNKFIQYLRAAIRLARREGQVRQVPTALRELGVSAPRQGFFQCNEFERIVVHLKDPIDDVARFGYATGWRLGEILGLEWSWVDRQSGVIRLPDSKNGEGRVIPLVGEIAEVIQRRSKKRSLGCPYVFHRRGRPIKTIQYDWGRAREAAGLPQKLFHDFRRTAARDLIDAGYDTFTAMQITGHKTVDHFKRYKIVDTRRMAEALEGVRRHRESGQNADSRSVSS